MKVVEKSGTFSPEVTVSL